MKSLRAKNSLPLFDKERIECVPSAGLHMTAQRCLLGLFCLPIYRHNRWSASVLAFLALPFLLNLSGCVAPLPSSKSSTGTTSTSSPSTSSPVLSGLNCASGSMAGTGTDTCTVTLNAAAGTGGQAVSLSSSATAVAVPASLTVPAGAASVSFAATVSSVSTAETATLTASSGSATKSYTISLGVSAATLTLQSTSVAFGDVTVGSPAYQSVTLTSTGTAAVTVSGISVNGTGYTISGTSFPLTLNPGQSATLTIEFNPIAAGAAAGTVTLTSNSSTGATAIVSLSGTGLALAYKVDLAWNAPTASPDQVTGYNIYRATAGGTTYQLLNSAIDSTTTYTDMTVANNTSYSYYVESVDAQGNQSVPSNAFTVTIP